MIRLIAKAAKKWLAPAFLMAGFLHPGVSAEAQQVKKAETPVKSLKRADFNFWGIPNSKYSTVVNKPAYKEYEAYAQICAKLEMDPNNSEVSAVPFFGGVADFSVYAQINGADIVPNQQYVWDAPGYYIPVINPPVGNNNPTIRAKREFADNLDQTIIATSPGWQYLNSKWDLSPSSLVVPDWMDDAIWQYQLSLNYAQPPTSWRHDFSESDKTFHWNFGATLDSLPHETTTNVTVMGDDAAIANGTVKIKWVRPPQLVYDVEINAGEWQRNGDTQTYGDWFNFWGSAASNQKLVDALTVEGCINAVGQPVAMGAEAGGKILIRATLGKAASAPFVSRMFSNAVTKVIGEEAAEKGWTIFGRKIEVRAAERGADDAVVDAAVDSRIAGPGASTEEAVPKCTREAGGCFTAGTPVVLADGSVKPIEAITPGELVLSRDPFTGRTSPKKVVQTHSREVSETLLLSFADGQKIEATANHPFFGYIAGQGKPQLSIIEAGHLPLGTAIVTRAGPPYEWATNRIVSLDTKRLPSVVYNLEVDAYHTYFVGADPERSLWVHNANPECRLGDDSGNPNLSETDVGGGEKPNRDVTDKAAGRNPDPEIEPGSGAIWERGNKEARETWDKLAPEDRSYTYQGETRERCLNVNRVERADGTSVSLDPTLSGGTLENPHAPSFQDGDALRQAYPGDGTYGERSLGSANPTHPETHADVKSLDQFEDYLKKNPEGDNVFQMHIRHPNGRGPCPDCEARILEFVTKHQNETVIVTYGARSYKIYSWEFNAKMPIIAGNVR